MSDQTSPPKARPALGIVSYAEAGNVAFAFMVLHSQVERLAKALDAGDKVTAEDVVTVLRSTIRSTDQHVPPARRMSKWISMAEDET